MMEGFLRFTCFYNKKGAAVDFIVAGAVALFLLAYLIYAMIYPDKF